MKKRLITGIVLGGFVVGLISYQTKNKETQQIVKSIPVEVQNIEVSETIKTSTKPYIDESNIRDIENIETENTIVPVDHNKPTKMYSFLLDDTNHVLLEELNVILSKNENKLKNYTGASFPYDLKDVFHDLNTENDKVLHTFSVVDPYGNVKEFTDCNGYGTSYSTLRINGEKKLSQSFSRRCHNSETEESLNFKITRLVDSNYLKHNSVDTKVKFDMREGVTEKDINDNSDFLMSYTVKHFPTKEHYSGFFNDQSDLGIVGETEKEFFFYY